MRVFFFCFLVLVGFVTDSQQTRRIRDVSGNGDQFGGKIADFAMKALGSFKSFMKDGNNELGIPRLDPVYMDNFNYSLENNPVGFRMEIVFESPALVGLSTYELNGASELRSVDGATVLQMTIVFPTIQVRGHYKAKGNMFSFFNLEGAGDFEIIGSSQVLAAEAKLRPINQTLFVEYITSQFVGGRVKSQFKDATSSAPFVGLVSDFLSEMGTQVFDKKLKPVITMAMNDYMKEWLNGAFSSVSINEILGLQVQPQPQSHPQSQQQHQLHEETPQQQQIPSYNNPPPQQLQQYPQTQQPLNQNLPQIQLQKSPSSNFQQFRPFGQ